MQNGPPIPELGEWQLFWVRVVEVGLVARVVGYGLDSAIQHYTFGLEKQVS